MRDIVFRVSEFMAFSLYISRIAPRKGGIWQLLGSVWKKVCEHQKIMRRYEKISLFLYDDVALLLGTEPLCFRPQFEDLPPTNSRYMTRWAGSGVHYPALVQVLGMLNR